MFDRNKRLESLFLEEVNFVLRSKDELKANGLFTVTGLEIIDEGKILKIYFSVYGSLKTPEENLNIINSFAWEIKQHLKKRLRIKTIPNVCFEFDETPQKAEKIERIFKKIEEEKASDGTSDIN